MSYAVKEIYYTLQGEGAQAGRAAVFCRFSGCNLWTGRGSDRESAVCDFCDTDFVGVDGPHGGRFRKPHDLARAIASAWPKQPEGATRPLVVATGGEPLLQLDADLVQEFHRAGFEVAIETNGTIEAPAGIDWICVSPKQGAVLRQTQGQELKLVFPQPGFEPQSLEDLDFEHFFLQPMDGPEAKENTKRTVAYCLEHPRWRLSLQTHKYLGIP